MEPFHGTTILSVRRDALVALGGDGQVTLGNVVVKATARKVRRLYQDRVLAGFAGATADAFTLFERFEGKLEKHQGHLTRAAVELAKDWRSDRILRRLEAMLAVADRSASLIITGNGDVLEPEQGIVAIGSGGPYAQAAARALLENTDASRARNRAAVAGHRRRALHLHQPQHRHRDAGLNAMDADAPADHRCDVLVAGAGLVGLAAAVALARAGLRVSLVDRAPVALPAPDPATWDSRVYAISPGSARFLEALGAWPPERLEAVEAMRVAGDGGSSLEFSAYELGERALAWIVEERALRAALVVAARPGWRPRAPAGRARRPRVRRVRRDGHAGGRHDDRRPARRRGRRVALLGAAGRRPGGRAPALPPDGGRREFRVRAAASRHRPPVVPARRGHPRVAAPARAAHLHRLVRARGDWRTSSPPCRPRPSRSASPTPARAGSVAWSSSRRPPAFPLHFMRLPAIVAHRLALVGRCRARRAPAGGAGRQPRLRRRAGARRGDGRARPLEDAGAPLLLERHARLRAEPVAAMQAVTDGLARLFGAQGRWVARLRNAGMAAVDRIPPLKRALAQPALR